MLSPFFDHVERELRSAVRQQKHLPWYARLRSRHPRGLIVVLAALVIAGPAVAAVSLLQSGSPVAPNAPLTPNAFSGVALRRGVQLLALRVPDPAGGPTWGMRVIRTSRGLVCLQIGREAFSTLGALGQAGAFGNDGRFHPFSSNYQGAPPCPVPDAHGNAFINVAEYGVPTSALFGSDQGNGCRTSTRSPRRGEPPSATRRAKAYDAQPVCQKRDLRDIYYGLLGPDATSITHLTSTGGLVTTPTAGRDGAYLIVLPDNTPLSNDDRYTYDPAVVPGAVRAVHYRDGHTCAVPAPAAPNGLLCQPVGYVSTRGPLPTPAQVKSPISVRVELSKTWCAPVNGPAEHCPQHLPPGLERLAGPPQALLIISFISRVALTNGHSYYEININRPPHFNPRYGRLTCAGGSDSLPTDSNYARGQRIVERDLENLSCQGIAHGNITLVTSTGPGVPAGSIVQEQTVTREVGHFSFRLP